MRWKGRERSTNVEDRRGAPVGRVAGGGSLILIIILVIAYFAGADIRPFLNAVNQGPGLGQPAPAPAGEGQDDDVREFIEVVLKDTENVWTELFRTSVDGGAYRPPQLVIFSATTPTGCGMANAAMGPFYCPADRKVYIDPGFFDELRRRHNAPGDFAQAYVIAHEVAHHVQNSLGLMREVNRARRSGDERAANRASVRLELQADYLAGVWAHHAQRQMQILERGDLKEALNAANQIGDDTLQRMSQGYVVPERFTHGTSEQRARWFAEGFRSGDLNGSLKLFELDYNDL